MLARRLARWFSQSTNKLTILHSTTNDIYFNLATEEALYEQQLTCPTLFLWRNERTIVIGKHQNPWKECHLQAMERDGVTLSRRITGGGAVYHDLGNTCFSFLTPYAGLQPLDYKTVNNEILLGALADLGVKAQASGRNDIVSDGKKISGSAYKLNLGNVKTGQGRKALHHGTILFNVSTEALKQYLNPNKAKLQSKGITSVIARVMNLNEKHPQLNHELFCAALEKRFVQHYKSQQCQKRQLTYDELQHNSRIAKQFTKLKSWEWLYGQSPKFNHNIETRFAWGIIDMYFDVQDGRIVQAKVYSDSINVELVSRLDDVLNSKQVPYDFAGIEHIKSQLKSHLKDTESQAQIQELCSWMKSQF